MKKRDPIHSTAYQNMRAALKALWAARNTPCILCGQATIDWEGAAFQPDSFELQHIISREAAKRSGRFELILDPNNCAPSHSRCNRSAGMGSGPLQLGETSEEY